MNNVILIGRLTGTPEIIQSENCKRTIVNLAVPRIFKNQDGIYETDFIRCVLWNGIANRASEYCKKGDIVCIRGRLQVRTYDTEAEKKYITEVIAETISFVSSVKSSKETEEKIA